MILPDFTKCLEFRTMRIEMGIEEGFIPFLPHVDFIKEVTEEIEHFEPDPVEEKLTFELAHGSIEIKDFVVGKFGLLEYKGRKVSVYIQNQKSQLHWADDKSSYKYHLCNCAALKGMRTKGQENRYLATSRSDEMFDVNVLSNRYGWEKKHFQNRLLKMDLCDHCKKILERKGIYSYPFILANYFRKHDDFVPTRIRRVKETKKLASYAPSREDLRREYSKAAHFICKLCDGDYSSNHSLLDLDCIDGNWSNTNHKNFVLLCVNCRSTQPTIQHEKTPDKESDSQTKEIEKLREQQGIPVLDEPGEKKSARKKLVLKPGLKGIRIVI